MKRTLDAVTEKALVVLSADELRDAVRGMLLDLGAPVRGRWVELLRTRAVRCTSDPPPVAKTEDDVAEVVAFVQAAERIGRADPADVDEYLARGSEAFERKAYAAASAIFGALLRSVADCAIDLSQDELLDEVLETDTAECAAQYVVSAYMLAEPNQRAEKVRAAIEYMSGLEAFVEPIATMERVSVEPLPDIEAFLPRWRALARDQPNYRRDSWLREVAYRIEGVEGLATIAQSTKRIGDLRAWCQRVVEDGDWKKALSAFEEAAELVSDGDRARAELLDGAAQAAYRLGRRDLSRWLERAWRAAPTFLRLRRWLGSAGGRAVAFAVESCPEKAIRQRGFLHVLDGDYESAAKLLANAVGLGWSSDEHPGHLLFPLFSRLLGGKLVSQRAMTLDELAEIAGDEDAAKLEAPTVDELLARARIAGPGDGANRNIVLAAMRKAAERRLAAVTKEKRRGHYSHAADLVAACLTCDRSAETARWASALSSEYRRFPALRSELDRAGVS